MSLLQLGSRTVVSTYSDRKEGRSPGKVEEVSVVG